MGRGVGRGKARHAGENADAFWQYYVKIERRGEDEWAVVDKDHLAGSKRYAGVGRSVVRAISCASVSTASATTCSAAALALWCRCFVFDCLKGRV